LSNKPVNQLLDALEQSHVTFPFLFLTRYHSLGLTDQEAMLLLHILAYQQMEGRFPDLDQLTDRMNLSKEEIAVALQRFTLSRLIDHEKQRLTIRPLLEQMVGMRERTVDALSIFHLFESEFGRLLSPLEQEQIGSWMDDDRYPEWMIVEALRESVLSGVFKFRYVDTILREWSRAQIKTERQLTEHREHYRQRPAQGDNRSRSSAKSSAKAVASDPQESASTRVLPAVQPGKYERFYQLYKTREEAAATSEHKSSV